MHRLLKSRLERAFALTTDLVEHLDETALGADLPDLPSNRISGQLWCMVGARESYSAAIEAGEWQGFSCSLKAPGDKAAVVAALRSSAERLSGIDFEFLSDRQLELGFDLLEHEIQHHGQLIRYVYGNRMTFPSSWNKRYTV
ncbi:MAG TPA: hypothetical protein PLC98_22375 [Anaerolineales bacterium]|nr:hypothetical protein [Anaerolineales bacterium]